MNTQEQNSSLKKGLNKRHIFFIAIGSAIGTGLFYGSAGAIKMAGPAVLLAYCVAGAAVFMVMRALGEMVLHKPLAGSFGSYATMYLGPLAGFLTGWTYVFEMVLVCLADVTAFATYMGFWFPDVSPWIWTLGVTLIITGLNLCAVKVFGEMEFILSSIKVLAIVAMVAGGLIIIFYGYSSGGVSHPATGFSNLWSHGGFMPNGIEGVIASLAIVMFAFGGVEIVGLTAAESQDMETNIPRAINTVPSRILLFYVCAVTVLMSISPWDQIGLSGSPFVMIFDNLGIPYAPAILNVVVITAAVSAINSDMFGAARMMFGLAEDKQAPAFFGRASAKGVPILPVLAMFAILLVGVVLNYFIHDQLFFIIAAMATFATVWVWLMILLSHFRMRGKMSTEERAMAKFPAPLWPIGPLLAIAFLVFCIVMLILTDTGRTALATGLIWVAGMSLCYLLFVKKVKVADEELTQA